MQAAIITFIRSHDSGTSRRALRISARTHSSINSCETVREFTTMIKGVVNPLTVLAVSLLLYTDLTESQCTTKYCEDHDEANLLSMCLRNQEVVEELQLELLSQRVEINELKKTVARLEKRKYSTIVKLIRYPLVP